MVLLDVSQDKRPRLCAFYLTPSVNSNLPPGAVVLVGLTIFLKVRRTNDKYRSLPLAKKISNLDPFGCLLFIGAVCCLLLALQWGGQTKPWNSPDVIGSLVGAFVTAVLFSFWQWKRGDAALIPFRVFRTRSVWTGAMVLFFLGAQAYVVSLLYR